MIISPDLSALDFLTLVGQLGKLEQHRLAAIMRDPGAFLLERNCRLAGESRLDEECLLTILRDLVNVRVVSAPTRSSTADNGGR